MSGEELQILNVVLPNKSREGVLTRAKELDASIVLDQERKRKAEADLQEMRTRAKEERFLNEYPNACEDALVRVAAKKVGVSEEAIKALSLEDKRNLARMIYEQLPKIFRRIPNIVKFFNNIDMGLVSGISAGLAFGGVMLALSFGFSPAKLFIWTFSISFFIGTVICVRANADLGEFVNFHERFLEIEKKMLAEKSEAEKKE